jgi:hypothetical protein
MQQGGGGHQGMAGVSLATQTTGSLDGALPAGGDPQQLQGSAGGAAAHGRGSGSAHSRHDSMDSIGSGDNRNQQQQDGGSCLDPQQQRRAGSIGGSRIVTFDAPAGSQQQQYKSRRLAPSGPPVHHSDSFLADGSHSSPSDIYARCVQAANLACCYACSWRDDVWLPDMLTLRAACPILFHVSAGCAVGSATCIHESSLCFAICFLVQACCWRWRRLQGAPDTHGVHTLLQGS